MAEFPHPVRTLQHLGWVALAKLEGAALATVAWFKSHVENEYRRNGPRDCPQCGGKRYIPGAECGMCADWTGRERN